MFRTVTLTVNNRPAYLSRVLSSLSRNRHAGWHLVIGLEPGDAECERLCKAIDFMPTLLLQNPARLGVRMNPFNVLDYAFHHASAANVYLEDDVVLAPDALDLADWYLSSLDGDRLAGQATMCLGLFNHSYDAEPAESVELVQHFCPLGWVANRQQWESYMRPQWWNDRHMLSPSVGWDYSLNARLKSDEGLRLARPRLSRSTHIGREGGTYMVPANHDQEFGSLVLSSAPGPLDYQVRR